MFIVMPAFWWRAIAAARSRRLRVALHVMLGWFVLQIGFGIATVLLLASPVVLAAAHQAGAMVLFAMVLWVNHELRVAA